MCPETSAPTLWAPRTTALRVVGAGASHVGHRRASNQDVFIVEPELGLYAVLDGMGGTNSGDAAARIAGSALISSVRQHGTAAHDAPGAPDLLETALDAAARAVFVSAASSEEYKGMGTTAVACRFIAPRRLVLGHAGDSRAYLLRGERFEMLTLDHTVAQELVTAGRLTAEEAEQWPGKHVLTRNLGDTNGVQPAMRVLELEPEDRLLLCSDGLHGELPDGVIRDMLGSSDAPIVIAHRFIEAVLDGAARDNVTAVVLAAEPPATSASGSAAPPS